MKRDKRPTIVFKRLSEVDRADLIDLMNHPQVRRHLPLAKGSFGPAECEEFIAAKERLWEEHGYGPWAIEVDGEFAGWGGLQPEGEDVDLGLVLHPKSWGLGRILYREFISLAFDKLGFESVTVLLPLSRTRVSGVLELGFEIDGEVDIAGQRFTRYRLSAPVG